uniref:Uncharacterized protein n=1 Tax=Plectus sambesii TaxID=2011161 RepID=A0A914WH48_9BILA
MHFIAEKLNVPYIFESEDDTPIPLQLWYALLRKLETDEMYSSIDDESSSGYSSPGGQRLSHGDSATSQGSISPSSPILPESPPPTRSLPIRVGSSITHRNFEYTDSDDMESWCEPTEKYTR